MMDMLKGLHKEESGQDLIEYALIGLIIALGAIAGMGFVGRPDQHRVQQDRQPAHVTVSPGLKQAMQERAGPIGAVCTQDLKNALAGRVAYERIVSLVACFGF